MKNFILAGLLPLFVFVFPTNGQISFTPNVAYTQNFDTLASTGSNVTWTNNTTLPGWYSNRVSYIAATGASSAGVGMQSYGSSTAAADRALGSMPGDSGTVQYGVRFKNNTAFSISSLTLMFVGEQWRAAASGQLVFDYRVSSSPITDVTSGTYTANTAFNFSALATGTLFGFGTDGNHSTNRTAKSGKINVVIRPGQEIMLRWTDIDDLLADHGLSIDNFSVVPNAAPTAAYISISGRVTELSGRGISNAVVTLSGRNFDGSIYARTSTFGYYKFDGLVAGETYVLSVGAKRYTFNEPAQTIVPGDNLDSVDFIAN